MRVFIVSTGRCGSTTFSHACKHIDGFTSAHETNNTDTNILFDYPDDHIESDPRLFWKLPQVIEKYPNAFWVHLIRDKETCVPSLARRRSLEWFAKFQAVHKILDSTQMAERYYDFTNSMIKSFLTVTNTAYMTMQCPPTEVEWQIFLQKINKVEYFDTTYPEWSIKYNS